MRPQSQTCNEALDGHIELDAPRPVLHALGKHQLRQLKLRLALTVGSQRCEPFLAGHDAGEQAVQDLPVLQPVENTTLMYPLCQPHLHLPAPNILLVPKPPLLQVGSTSMHSATAAAERVSKRRWRQVALWQEAGAGRAQGLRARACTAHLCPSGAQRVAVTRGRAPGLRPELHAPWEARHQQWEAEEHPAEHPLSKHGQGLDDPLPLAERRVE